MEGVGSAALATVVGSADQVLLWLWGRAGNEAVSTSGDTEPSVLREALARQRNKTRAETPSRMRFTGLGDRLSIQQIYGSAGDGGIH